MTRVVVNCLCGHLFTEDIKGEGKIVCKKCYRVWVRHYNPKDETYEITLIREEPHDRR